jgi:hypothetical protein
MAESINQRMAAVPDLLTSDEIRQLLNSVLTDLAALRTALNAHTHGGITAGSASSGVASVSTMGTLNTVQ